MAPEELGKWVRELVARLAAENLLWRVDAEQQLARLGEVGVVALCSAAASTDPTVRVHALAGLLRTQDPRAIPVLIGALHDTERQGAVAIAAERFLVRWGSPVNDQLVEAAGSGSEVGRARALRACARIGHPGCERVLRAWLADPALGVRLQAALGLLRVLGPEVVSEVSALLDATDESVRLELAEALVGVGSPVGRTALEALAGSATDEELRDRAAQLLEELECLPAGGADKQAW